MMDNNIFDSIKKKKDLYIHEKDVAMLNGTGNDPEVTTVEDTPKINETMTDNIELLPHVNSRSNSVSKNDDSEKTNPVMESNANESALAYNYEETNQAIQKKIASLAHEKKTLEAQINLLNNLRCSQMMYQRRVAQEQKGTKKVVNQRGIMQHTGLRQTNQDVPIKSNELSGKIQRKPQVRDRQSNPSVPQPQVNPQQQQRLLQQQQQKFQQLIIQREQSLREKINTFNIELQKHKNQLEQQTKLLRQQGNKDFDIELAKLVPEVTQDSDMEVFSLQANTCTNQFLFLSGLEDVIHSLEKKPISTDISLLPNEPYSCNKCGTDVSPQWHQDCNSNRTLCATCSKRLFDLSDEDVDYNGMVRFLKISQEEQTKVDEKVYQYQLKRQQEIKMFIDNHQKEVDREKESINREKTAHQQAQAKMQVQVITSQQQAKTQRLSNQAPSNNQQQSKRVVDNRNTRPVGYDNMRNALRTPVNRSNQRSKVSGSRVSDTRSTSHSANNRANVAKSNVSRPRNQVDNSAFRKQTNPAVLRTQPNNLTQALQQTQLLQQQQQTQNPFALNLLSQSNLLMNPLLAQQFAAAAGSNYLGTPHNPSFGAGFNQNQLNQYIELLARTGLGAGSIPNLGNSNNRNNNHSAHLR